MTERLLARGDRVVADRPQDRGSRRSRGVGPGDRLRVMALDVTDTEGARYGASSMRRFRRTGAYRRRRQQCGLRIVRRGRGTRRRRRSDRQIATNLVGSIQVIRAALPHLRDQGGGRILQVSSEGGQIAYPNFSLYHATEWGIEGFVEAVAQEVAAFGIELTLVEYSSASPAERRPELPRESALLFWPRFAWETVKKQTLFGVLILRLMLWSRAVFPRSQRESLQGRRAHAGERRRRGEFGSAQQDDGRPCRGRTFQESLGADPLRASRRLNRRRADWGS